MLLLPLASVMAALVGMGISAHFAFGGSQRSRNVRPASAGRELLGVTARNACSVPSPAPICSPAASSSRNTAEPCEQAIQDVRPSRVDPASWSVVEHAFLKF